MPKAIADQYGIPPGDEIRVVAGRRSDLRRPVGRRRKCARELDRKEQLELFNRATERQRRREAMLGQDRPKAHRSADQGWSMGELYRRGRAD